MTFVAAVGERALSSRRSASARVMSISDCR